jgi:alanine-synthesizing transaminase
MVSYHLNEEQQWAIDFANIENSISIRTRALVVISPHNPTGHVSTHDELEAIAGLALRHDLAVIADEVFSEFLIERRTLPRPTGSRAPLVLTLNGFSKMFALPGVKFGWMAVSGEQEKVRRAMRALELISDTFLPVNEIVQAAAPDIFEQGQDFLDSYAGEIRRRWWVARELIEQAAHCSCCFPGGGFYAALKLDQDEEAAAKAVLQRAHLLVHPGYFYDIEPHHLVLSFVLEPQLMREVFSRLFHVLGSE